MNKDTLALMEDAKREKAAADAQGAAVAKVHQNLRRLKLLRLRV